MALNLNSFPYFDDYNPTKKYHRILFRPGVAVQARELTQVQTILQEQIRRFGDHVFKEGSVITGCAESHNFAFPFVTIEDTFNGGGVISPEALQSYEGAIIEGQTTGVRAIIKKVAQGDENSIDLKTFYIQYIDGGSDTETTAFADEEILSLQPEGDIEFKSIATGFGSLFSLGDGVVYAQGNFILHSEQTIILDRYSTTPTRDVGFVVVERIIDAVEDTTLLDPAQGSFNYTAPGADRYFLSTELVSFGVNDVVPDTFHKLFEVDGGEIQRRYDATQYGELNKTLARRTYDESGDYTVRPFSLTIENDLSNPSNYAVAIGPGKAYVRGFEHELLSTLRLTAPRATALDNVENQAVGTYFGNYFLIENPVGAFLPGNTVQLRNSDDSSIGTARVRSLEFHAPGDIYRLHVYDVKLTSSSLGNVDNVFISPSTEADISGPAILHASGFNSLVFPLSYGNLGEITDMSYTFRQVFPSVFMNTASHFEINLVGDDIFFPFTPENSAVHVTLIANASVDGGITEGEYLKPDSISYSAQQISGDLGLTINNDTTVTAIVSVVRSVSAANQKAVRRNRFVGFDTGTVGVDGPYCLGVADAIALKNVWIADDSEDFADYETPAWENVTSQFALDDGQKDSYYDLSAIRKLTDINLTDKKILVQFDYLHHGTTSGYYTVNSYRGIDGPIEFEEIPKFVASSGKTFNLRDVIDFRPTVTSSGDFDDTTAPGDIDGGDSFNIVHPGADNITFIAGVTIPSPNGVATLDLAYYLPRIDRVVVNETGSFVVVEGVASTNPVYPREPDNSMTIGFIHVAPLPSLSEADAYAAARPEYANSVVLNDNRRFTMRDIGQISRRVERLEYYTALSLLELNTSTMTIPNESGDDRFKHGILVDSFKSADVVDRYNSAVNCSIGDGVLRPGYNLDNINLRLHSLNNLVTKPTDATILVRQASTAMPYDVGSTVTSSSSATGVVRHVVPVTTLPAWRWVRLYLTNVTGSFGANNSVNGPNGLQTGAIVYGAGASEIPIDSPYRPPLVSVPEDGPLVTLPYTHSLYAENPYASKSRRCSNSIVFSYEGFLTLNPAIDPWTAPPPPPPVSDNQPSPGTVSPQPDQLRKNRQGDNWAWGGGGDTVHAAGQTTEYYTPVQETTPSPTPPPPPTPPTHMRSIVVEFKATGLRPNTRFFPYFDGVDVSLHTRMAFYDLITGAFVMYGVWNESLYTDANGEISGQFRIPPDTFLSGTKVFTLINDSVSATSLASTSVASTFFTSGVPFPFTSANVVGTAIPSTTYSRQHSTQNVDILRQIDTAVIEGTISDPIAQTFFVSNNPGGMFLSKVDLFFRTKSTNSPIAVQIREVINGVPSQTILPYSTVIVHPEDVNLSEDGSSPTEFTFSSPVYLKNATEYALVVLPIGGNELYQIWVSELGEVAVGTNEVIDRQPNSGVLFTSSNGRAWTAYGNEDLKFNLYQSTFNHNVTGSLVLRNTAFNYVSLGAGGDEFEIGDLVVTGAPENPDGIGSIVGRDEARGRVTISVFEGSFDISDTIADFEYDDSTEIVVGSKSATITGMFRKPIDAISPSIAYLDFNETDVVWGHRIMADSAPIDPMTFTPFTPTGFTDLPSRRAVYSFDSQPQSLFIQATVDSEQDNLSPVIDLNTTSVVIQENAINGTFTDEDAGDAGDALSRYISKPVVLIDGMEAEDLNVFLTAKLGGDSMAHVYAKLRADTDETNLKDMGWVKLNSVVNTQIGEFTEYRFSLPDTVLNHEGTYQYVLDGGTYVGFKTFAVKIVLTTNNPSVVPIVRDMRAIALSS